MLTRFLRPRWDQVYFSLAGLAVLTIAVSLYLNHHIVSLSKQSVQSIAEWAEIRKTSAEVGQAAASLNAPGNDVFQSHDPAAEAARLSRAQRIFEEKHRLLTRQIAAAATPSQRPLLENDLRAIRDTVKSMERRTKSLFAAYRAGQLAEAGEHMARMDHDYVGINAALDILREHIATIEQEQFENQAYAAVRLQGFEYMMSAGVLLMVILATAYGKYAADQRNRAEHALQEAHDTLEQRVHERTADLERATHARDQLLRQVLTTQENERRRIARDLHDEIGQSLTSLVFGLKSINPADLPQELHERIGTLRGVAGSTLNEIRRLAHGLRPSVLDDVGLLAALERFTSDLERAYGINVELSSNLGAGRLPDELETTLYRIVQESLTNVAKHAEASLAEVTLRCEELRVDLVVSDDGRGFDPAVLDSAGFGLSGMRERAALFGGALEVESAVGAGTTIRVTLPLSENCHAEDSSAGGR